MPNQIRRAVLFISEAQSGLLSSEVLGAPLIGHIAEAFAEAGITSLVAIGTPYYPAVASAFESFLQLERREEAVPYLLTEAEITFVLAAPALIDAAALSDLRSRAQSLGPTVLMNGATPLVYALVGTPDEALARAVAEDSTDGFCISEDTTGLCCAASTLSELILAEDAFRLKIVAAHIKNGVRITGGSTVYIAPSVCIAPGAAILPNTVITGSSKIGAGCVIGPNSVISNCVVGDGTTVNASQMQDSTIGRDVTVGPFAFVRPDSIIGDRCRIGDFVEIKNSTIGADSKVSHLTYIGDSDVGERVNFGCGAVTVNYNGVQKRRTTVGDDAFIGCNTNLIAPATVGARAYTAAGTTVTGDVPEESLAIGRVRAEIKPGWWTRLFAAQDKTEG